MVTIRNGIVKIIKKSLYLCKSTWIFMKIWMYVPVVATNHPKFSTPGDLPQMANIWHRVYTNIQDVPIYLPNQLRSLWSFQLKPLGFQLITPTCLNKVGYPQMGTIRDGVVQIMKQNLFCQINSDLNETINLRTWSTNLSPNLVQCRWATPQMATIRNGAVQIIKKSLYICQINSDPHETLN